MGCYITWLEFEALTSSKSIKSIELHNTHLELSYKPWENDRFPKLESLVLEDEIVSGQCYRQGHTTTNKIKQGIMDELHSQVLSEGRDPKYITIVKDYLLT